LGRKFFCCIGDAFPWVFLDLGLQLNRSPQRRLLVREGGISMPIIRVNEAALYYEEHGTGSETIVFAHGLLWSCRMFDAQVAQFKEHYRCVAFDFRGQGQSEVTRSGYDMETLYEDAIALIEQLGCAPCHFLGLSMGGFIGLRLAARHPELLRSLILLETTAGPEPSENVAKYKQLTFVARWFGLGLVVDRVMPVMFGRTFLGDPVRAGERREWRQRMSENHRLGITRATTGVITL
jgi:3-oxoadipate enol-lactonase